MPAQPESALRLPAGRSLCGAPLAGLLLGLVSCGGGDGGDGDTNIGWISIQSSTVTVGAGGTALAELSGAAVVSTAYVAHQCIGLACLFTSYDDSYPGVDVGWMNLTTGTQGTAVSRYGTATDWEHLWYASVPLSFGVNTLQVAATDPAGNSATASVSVEYTPPAPSDLRADTGDGNITLNWSPVPYATAYRLYWATTPGVAFPLGTSIDVAAPPYVHSGVANGTTYYYVITSRYLSSESPPSAQVATTAGVPPRPSTLDAVPLGSDVQLSWDPVPTADTYTLYWANEPGVTSQIGAPIAGAISPYLHTGLSGLPYYYVVTAVNGYGESLESQQVMAFPQLAPPAPGGLSAVQRTGISGSTQVIDLAWQAVPGADYEVYRCSAGLMSTPDYCESTPLGCRDSWERIGTSADTVFADWTVSYTVSWYNAYRYYLTASNPYGSSAPSDWVSVCVVAPPY